MGQNSLMVQFPRLNSNHGVAFLGLILALSVYGFMSRAGVPSKICCGSAILSMLVVAMFWSAISLGADDEDEL
jgi:hypothetical protein